MTESIVHEKICTRCGEAKPLGRFQRSRRIKSGTMNQCRDCTNRTRRESTARLRLRVGVDAYQHRLRALYYQRKESRKCARCGDMLPDQESYRSVSCMECRKKLAEHTNTTRAKRKLAGLCGGCGKEKLLKHSADYCFLCYIKNQAASVTGNSRNWPVLLEAWERQNHQCAYTGQSLVLGFNSSLDHILPLSRYPEKWDDPHNLQWVERRVNTMKGGLEHEEFLGLIATIYRHAIPPLPQ